MSVSGFATQSGLHQFAIQAPEALGGQLRLALHLALLLAWHHLSALLAILNLKGGGPKALVCFFRASHTISCATQAKLAIQSFATL